MITRSTLLFATLAALSGFSPAFGQSTFHKGTGADNDSNKNPHRAVGVWLWTNSPTSPGLAPGNSLIVFHEGGLTTSTSVEPSAATADGSRQSTEYGTWEKVSETELDATWYSLFVSPTNVPLAIIRVQSRIKLDAENRM